MNPADWTLVPMTAEHARQVSRWSYEGEYAFYNGPESDGAGVAEGADFSCLFGKGLGREFVRLGLERRIR